MQIYSSTLTKFIPVKPEIVFLTLREDKPILMVILDGGKHAPDESLFCSDFLIDSEKQFMAFCKLANLSFNAPDSYYAYLDAIHKTYTYH